MDVLIAICLLAAALVFVSRAWTWFVSVVRERPRDSLLHRQSDRVVWELPMNWMIRHKTEESAWWHDRYGWSPYAAAQVFTSDERMNYVLPRNGFWVRRRT